MSVLIVAKISTTALPMTCGHAGGCARTARFPKKSISPRDRSQPRYNCADGHQPRREIRPHYFRGAPINEIGEESAGETGNGYRYENGVNGVSTDAGCRINNIARHQTPFYKLTIAERSATGGCDAFTP
jgi:hypothetical protein